MVSKILQVQWYSEPIVVGTLVGIVLRSVPVMGAKCGASFKVGPLWELSNWCTVPRNAWAGIGTALAIITGHVKYITLGFPIAVFGQID